MGEECSCPAEAGAATCELRVAAQAPPCPVCGQTGKSVDVLTVKALLAVPLTEVRETEHRFCRTAHCPVVYYAVDGERRFLEDDVRELVYQKHPDEDDAFVCYCFRHTVRTLRRDVSVGRHNAVIAAITAGIQAGACACDIRNPQGSCCLGNVGALLRRLTSVTA